MNLYAYVHNDPLNFTDPTGESSVFGGTSAPTMQAVQQACGGDSSCVQEVASDMLKAEATIVSTVIPVGEIAVAAAAAKAARTAKTLRSAKNAAKGSGKKPKSSVNKLGPDAKAEGPHTQFKRDPKTGRVNGYTEFDAAGNPVKRFRGDGKTHGGVEPPLVLEPKAGKGPGSPPKVPRPARPDELPRGF